MGLAAAQTVAPKTVTDCNSYHPPRSYRLHTRRCRRAAKTSAWMGVAKGHARDRHLFQDRGVHHKSADQCVLGIGHLRMHLVLDDAVALAVPNTPSPTSQTILFSRVRPRVRAPA